MGRLVEEELLMNNKQREMLATSFKDLGNLTIAALVIGQALANQKNLQLLLAGFIAYVIFNIVSVLLVGGEDND